LQLAVAFNLLNGSPNPDAAIAAASSPNASANF